MQFLSGGFDGSFITYRPVPHLDRKHTVFGKVVGGLEILDKLEDMPTNHDEKPEEDIRIHRIIIFVDPFDVIPWHRVRVLRVGMAKETTR